MKLLRGRAGNAGSTSIVFVRLDSAEQHAMIHQASRGRGISVNSFCLAAIVAAAQKPDDVGLTQAMERRAAELELIKKTPRTKEQVKQSVEANIQATSSSDPFDFISLKQLSAIAKLADIEESKAFMVIQLFIERLKLSN